jgi:signal transduction histidine kinase
MTGVRGGPPPGRPGPPGRPEPLYEREMHSEDDVFAARRLARDAAAALGLDTHGQVRFATALSEVARDTLRVGGARIAFQLGPTGVFTVTLTTARPLPADPAEVPGLAAARRLIGHVDVAALPPHHSLITLTRTVTPSSARLPEQRREVQRALESATGRSPLEELRAQNSDLLAALDQLQANQQQLLQLNRELDETNKGVMAMYGELSAELEETNRGVVALYADLDERGVQLQQANEAKNRFLRSVSHELRTPVNSILGLTGLLLDPYAEVAGEQRRQVELIRGSAAELYARINQLLDIAKAESGRIEPVFAEVELGPLFVMLRGRIRPLLAEGVALVIDVPDVGGADSEGPGSGGAAGIGPVRSDEGLLRDILNNLLGNAAKYTERGEIRMTASVAAGRLTISVRDTGIGIPAAEQEKIFDEFYQVPGPAQARTKGTGLGLPYARRIAQLLGGGLTVASEPGAGATFTLWLPYGSAPLPLAVVVDDDPAYRAVLLGWLRPYAERTLAAASVAEARALLRDTVPAVVLLDLGLPDADGTTLLAAIAADPRLRAVPVVVITAADPIGPDTVEALAPAVAVLSKAELTEPRLAAVLTQVVAAG